MYTSARSACLCAPSRCTTVRQKTKPLIMHTPTHTQFRRNSPMTRMAAAQYANFVLPGGVRSKGVKILAALVTSDKRLESHYRQLIESTRAAGKHELIVGSFLAALGRQCVSCMDWMTSSSSSSFSTGNSNRNIFPSLLLDSQRRARDGGTFLSNCVILKLI